MANQESVRMAGELMEMFKKQHDIKGRCFCGGTIITDIVASLHGVYGSTIPIPKVVGYHCESCGLKYEFIPVDKLIK